ncbi:MAG: type II toxin-antitoxin system VapC family toxin [Oceanobacter sp.]
MIVADTNIISYLLLPTRYTESVETLFHLEPVWAAPVLWRSEFRNVLALYLRKEIISFDQMLKLQEQAEDLMNGNEYELSSAQILRLVNESECSSYDCEFAALAKHLNTRLVTQDKQILREFPSTAMSISDYIDTYRRNA